MNPWRCGRTRSRTPRLTIHDPELRLQDRSGVILQVTVYVLRAYMASTGNCARFCEYNFVAYGFATEGIAQRATSVFRCRDI
jgi:hypothetical protein